MLLKQIQMPSGYMKDWASVTRENQYLEFYLQIVQLKHNCNLQKLDVFKKGKNRVVNVFSSWFTGSPYGAL